MGYLKLGLTSSVFLCVTLAVTNTYIQKERTITPTAGVGCNKDRITFIIDIYVVKAIWSYIQMGKLQSYSQSRVSMNVPDRLLIAIV